MIELISAQLCELLASNCELAETVEALKMTLIEAEAHIVFTEGLATCGGIHRLK